MIITSVTFLCDVVGCQARVDGLTAMVPNTPVPSGWHDRLVEMPGNPGVSYRAHLCPAHVFTDVLFIHQPVKRPL